MPYKESTDTTLRDRNHYFAPKGQYAIDLEEAISQAKLDEIIVASYADSQHVDDRPITRFDTARDLYLLHDPNANRAEAAKAMHYACAEAVVEYIYGQIERDGSLHDATLETLQSYSIDTLQFVTQAIGQSYVDTSVRRQALVTEQAMYGVENFEQQVAQLDRQQLALIEAFSHVGIAHGVNEAAGHKVYGFIASQRVKLESLSIDTNVHRQLKALDTLAEEALQLRLNKAGEYVQDDSANETTDTIARGSVNRISPKARIVTATTLAAIGLGFANVSTAAASPIPTRSSATIEGDKAPAVNVEASVRMAFNPAPTADFVVADFANRAFMPENEVMPGMSSGQRIVKEQSNAKPPVVTLDLAVAAVATGEAVVLADIAKPAHDKTNEAPIVAELPPAAIVTDSGAYIVPATVVGEKPSEAPAEAPQAVISPETGETPSPDTSATDVVAKPAETAPAAEAAPEAVEDTDFMIPETEEPVEAEVAPEATTAPDTEQAPETKADTPEVKKQTPVERWTAAAAYAGKINKWGTYKKWVVEETVEQTLQNGGSLKGAAGFVGSAKGESNYVPGIVERGNGIGLGIFQHSFGRRDNLEAGAEKRGVDVYKNTRENVEYQVGFSIGESKKRTERDGSGNEWKGLNAQKTPEKAAAYFQWNFERPREVAIQSVRTKEARAVYNQIIAADKVLQTKLNKQAAAAQEKAKAKAKADAAAKARTKPKEKNNAGFKVVDGPVSKAGYGAPLPPEILAKTPLTARYDGYSKEFSNEYLEKNGVYPHHDGLDYAVPVGTPVIAVDDATVVRVGDYRDGQELQAVMLDHGYDKNGRHIMTNYEHLKPGSFKVKEGDKINRGTVMALSGVSGTGAPHLHVTFITDDPNKDGRVGVTNPDFKEQTDDPEDYFPNMNAAKRYLEGKASN